jgi:DNA-binding GntR family transcriptional regulator
MSRVGFASATNGLEEEADPAAARIARTLEHDIVLGRIPPGEKLREADLAQRFSASRHHVREGLARLERIGIVSRTRNRGVSVRRFTPHEVFQIYEIREILQRQAALRIRLPVDPATVQSLTGINMRYEAAVDAGDFQRIHEANDLFHTELFRLCGNDQLLQLVKSYMDLTYAIRGTAFGDPENLEVSRRHHRIMLELLNGTDSWALAQICVDHIQSTKTLYLAVLQQQGEATTDQ